MANVSGSIELYLEKWRLFLEKTLCDSINESIYLLLLSMTGIIFIFSLVGNSITFLIICCDKSMHTTTNYYLANLAVCDLIMTFTLFLEILETQSDPEKLILCKLQWFLAVCSWNNSILTIAVVAIERYVAIWYPFKLKPTSVWRRVAKIFLLWLVAIVETLFEVQFVALVKVHQFTMCVTVPTPWARVTNGVIGVVTFVIPIITMIFAYSTILYKVITSNIDNTRDTIVNQQDPRGKISKRVILITVSFFVCGMPLFLFRMLLCALNIDQLLLLPVSWHTWFFIIMISSWASVVLNPILYSLMSTKFRKAAKNIYNEKIRRVFLS